MKKKFAWLVLVTLAAAALIFVLAKPQRPQGKINFTSLVYEDGEFKIYNENKQYLLYKKGPDNERLTVPTDSESRFERVDRLTNKPAREIPLYGQTIANGVKIVDSRKTHVVDSAPELKLLASYPTPGTGEDKIIIDKEIKIALFLQRRGTLQELPGGYREGLLFYSGRNLFYQEQA